MICRRAEGRVEVRENMRGGGGKVTIRHCFERDAFESGARLCAKLTLPPGTGIGPHAHTGEDEVYLVLRGGGWLVDGEGEHRIEKGDAVLTGRGASHALRNDGVEDLEIFAMIACGPGCGNGR